MPIFADSHSPSAEELAQDVISRYRASNTLDSHTALSSGDDAMHLFLQPTDEDPPLWVCKVKASFWFLTSMSQYDGSTTCRLAMKRTLSCRFSSAAEDLTCSPPLLCLRVQASCILRRPPSLKHSIVFFAHQTCARSILV